MSPRKTKTSVGQETVDETVARAKAQLGEAYVPPTPTPVAKTGTTVITPSSLEPTMAPVVTPVPTPTAAPKLQADLETAQEDALAQKLTAERTTAEAGKTTALQSYLDQLKTNKGLTTLTSEAYAEKGGVNEITPELNDINDQIRREQLAMRRMTEKITGEGGQSKAQAQAMINNVQRESLAKQADLSIIQMAVQGRYDSATEIADRAVSAQFEQQTQATEIAKFDYTENKDLFTKAEQREYDLLFSDRERKLQEAQQNASDIKQFALQALQAGASVSEARQAMGAKTMDEAIGMVGSYFRPKPVITAGSTFTGASGEAVKVPTFEEFIDEKQNELQMTLMPSEREKYRAEYESEVAVMEQAVKVSQLSPMAREVVNNPQAYYDLTPTVRGEVFSELARNGIDTNSVLQGKKKSLPATQAQNLAQAQGVKSDVEKLYTMLQSLPGKGPVSGRLNALNPYDPQRVAVEAQMTRIIPGLARGIFGEVGVLTDQDVARYRETIANPNMTDVQIEQLHQDTLAKIEQSIGTTVDTFASLGYDTGTFGGQTVADNLSDDEAYAEYLRITGQK